MTNENYSRSNIFYLNEIKTFIKKYWKNSNKINNNYDTSGNNNNNYKFEFISKYKKTKIIKKSKINNFIFGHHFGNLLIGLLVNINNNNNNIIVKS